MGQERNQTIDSFISHKQLGGWETPKPKMQLSWKEIKGLHQEALRLHTEWETADWRQQSELKNLLHERLRNLEKAIHIQCLSWTPEDGRKPLAVRIHDWLENNSVLGLHKLLALKQQLWYQAIAWEFEEWRRYIFQQYSGGTDPLDVTIERELEAELDAEAKGLKGEELEAAREKALDGLWYEDYYRQKALLYRWLYWRGLRLSARDIRWRLGRYIYLGGSVAGKWGKSAYKYGDAWMEIAQSVD